jgi:hypothetical protein
LDGSCTLIRAQGERASSRFIDSFSANIRNRNTRMACAHTVKSFSTGATSASSISGMWSHSLLRPTAYIEQLGAEA